MSGIGRSSTSGEKAILNLITGQDALKVDAMLKEGKADAAKQFILNYAPEGKEGKSKVHASNHLRARARAYQALGEFDKALADVKELISRHLRVAHRTSERSDEMIMDEALRDEINRQIKGK